MANHLNIKPSAQEAFNHAGGEGQEEISHCLKYIQDHPEPGDQIVAINRPPAVLYAYDNGTYHILFSVSRIPDTGDTNIVIRGITPSVG